MARLPRLDDAAVTEALKGTAGWARSGDGIERRYQFANFRESLAFVNRVGALAEELDHHPDIVIEYSKVRLFLTTHDSGGLTTNDFELARRIDA